jgi:hypothetical protein
METEVAMKAITRNLDRGIWRDLMKSGMLSSWTPARDQWYNSLEKTIFRLSAKRIF